MVNEGMTDSGLFSDSDSIQWYTKNQLPVTPQSGSKAMHGERREREREEPKSVLQTPPHVAHTNRLDQNMFHPTVQVGVYFISTSYFSSALT